VNPKSNKKAFVYMVLCTLVISLVLFVIYGIAINWAFEDGLGESSTAQFGDAFGAITGFVTACALGITAISLYFQREELRATFSEMRQSREAQEEQAEVAKQSMEVQERYTTELAKLNDILAEIGAMYQIRNSFDALRTDLENEVRQWEATDEFLRTESDDTEFVIRKAEILKQMARLASLVPLHPGILNRLDAMFAASSEEAEQNQDEGN